MMRRGRILPSLLAALLALAPLCALAAEKTPLPRDLPPYGQEQPFKAPRVKATTLDNGQTVWLVSRPGYPQVSFVLIVRGGFASDPADRPGISELLTATIDQGTATRSARQIAEVLQATGGDLRAYADKDYTAIATTVLSDRAETALAVLADLVQNATFPEEEVALAKRNLADSLRQREAEPDFLAARALARVMFRDSPYAVIAPTQESIAAATAEELREVYAQRFRPDQALLVAVGDFNDRRMLARIKSGFRKWKGSGEAAKVEPPTRPAPPEHGIFLVPRPGSVQTTILFGSFAPVRSAPDYEAAQVANALYGEMFGSRLVLNIREDKGYTYSPGSDLAPFRGAGLLTTQADVRNEVTAAALNEMIYELNRMATTSPTEEEMATARRYLIGLEAIIMQRRSSVAAQLSMLWLHGLPPEEIGNHGQKVAAVTAADVEAVGRKYFPARQAAIVAVGEEEIVREAAAPFGLEVVPAP